MPRTKLKKQGRIPHKVTFVSGIKFDSSIEARRYRELMLIYKSNPRRVQNLTTHPKFVLLPKFTHKATGVNYRQTCYTPDFMYTNEHGDTVIEEVKSSHSKKERDYQIRKKLLLFQNMGIIFKEIIY